jgi:hypothetical protein
MRSTFALLLATLPFLSCSSGPPAPKTGTPPYYWQAALETYNAGDYRKAVEHLGKILRSDNEFAARARPLHLVLLSGQLRGYAELADRFEDGARATKGPQGPLRKHTYDLRGLAHSLAIELSDSYAAFQKASPSGDVSVEFPYPARGGIGSPPQLLRIAEGQTLPVHDIDTLQTTMVQRGVVQEVASAVGAPGDIAKAQEILKTIPAAVPRATFQLAMAKGLYEAARLYGPLKRSETPRQEFLCNQALKALEGTDKDKAKELRGKIEKDLKEIKARKG